MPNYIGLEKEDKKKLLKYVTEKEYKDAILNASSLKQAMARAFHKPEPNRVKLPEFRTYIERNCENPKNKIVDFYTAMLYNKWSDKFDHHDKLKNMLNEISYNELTDEQKSEIESYRETYENSDMPINYDSYVRFLCLPNEEELAESEFNKIQKEKEKLEEDLTKKNEEHSQLLSEKNELMKQIKALNTENTKLKSFEQSYERMVAVDSIRIKMGSLFDESFTATSYKEIYEELNKKEKAAIDASDYDLCQKTLAAKYALSKAMKEENR